MEGASYQNKSSFAPLKIDAEDHKKGVPVHMIWSSNMVRRLSYADRLGSVRTPTLVLVSRHDPEAPLPASEQLIRGIPDARLVILEDSGHYPFVEEASHFADAVDAFLNLDRV
jgi:proline iminopeptidase